MSWPAFVDRHRYSRAGKFCRRLWRRLTAGYGRLSWILAAAVVLLMVTVGSLLTTTPDDPVRAHQPCGESYWEGLGRDGTPCP
uniref:Uncharacterized protein n=1 Tax=uncultured prokaryote TaxID=198431 RepID=A0A0H5Q3C1_9ZZZZ|nr:hypothetical protein [uncultured prokaryote]